MRAVATKAVLNCCRRILVARLSATLPATVTTPPSHSHSPSLACCCADATGSGDASSAESHGLSSSPVSDDALGSRQSSATSIDDTSSQEEALLACGRRTAAMVQGALGVANAIAGREFVEQLMVVAADLVADALGACEDLNTGGALCIGTHQQIETAVDAVLHRIDESGALATAIDRLFDLSARWASGRPLVDADAPDRIAITADAGDDRDRDHLPHQHQVPAGLICF